MNKRTIVVKRRKANCIYKEEWRYTVHTFAAIRGGFEFCMDLQTRVRVRVFVSAFETLMIMSQSPRGRCHALNQLPNYPIAQCPGPGPGKKEEERRGEESILFVWIGSVCSECS